MLFIIALHPNTVKLQFPYVKVRFLKYLHHWLQVAFQECRHASGGDSRDDGLRIEHVGRSATNHLDCQTDCYTPNLTTISRSPPNHGESRLHHATISPSLRALSLTHTLTRTTKLTLRFQPACMSCRIGSAQAGVWATDSLRVIYVPSEDGAGELRRARVGTALA